MIYNTGGKHFIFVSGVVTVCVNNIIHSVALNNCVREVKFRFRIVQQKIEKLLGYVKMDHMN